MKMNLKEKIGCAISATGIILFALNYETCLSVIAYVACGGITKQSLVLFNLPR